MPRKMIDDLNSSTMPKISHFPNINYNPGTNLPNEIVHPEGIIQDQNTGQ